MNKNITHSNQGEKLKLRLVQCLLFLASITTNFTITAQTATQDSMQYWEPDISNDHFWDPKCPTPNSIIDGYNTWVLRQKMATRAYQTIMNNEVYSGINSRPKVKNIT